MIKLITMSKGLLLFSLFWVFNLSVVSAAEFQFTPKKPIIEVSKSLTLSVYGTSGKTLWKAIKGQLQDSGKQVTYIAPTQQGMDVVTVLDGDGNVGTLNITVTLPNTFSHENSIWKIFASRRKVGALTLSDDGETLWVGTEGGLEKRDAKTGQLLKNGVLTNVDGLPHSSISSRTLVTDDENGLWIGTYAGLTHLNSNNNLTVYNTENSSLPHNVISFLSSDNKGGIWIGTDGGLAHLNNKKKWTVFNTVFSPSLPSEFIYSLLDTEEGVWIGTNNGFSYLFDNSNRWNNFPEPVAKIFAIANWGDNLWLGTKNGLIYLDMNKNNAYEWWRYTAEDSELPHNTVYTILEDNDSGFWMGTRGGGIAHLKVASMEWRIFNTENSELPSNDIWAIIGDGNDGLWIGTGDGLAHLNLSGNDVNWTVFQEKSNIPHNQVKAFTSDDGDGMWMGTIDGLAHLNKNNEWTILNTENSDLPNNFVSALTNDGSGGIWVGTKGNHIANFKGNKEWTILDTEHFNLSDENLIAYLERDRLGGLWVGLVNGLAYLNVDKEWSTFTPENSNLPNDSINQLVSDGNGGLWIGTQGGGLAHLIRTEKDDKWKNFTADNSELPNNFVISLVSDNNDGIWVGTWEGLAHLKSNNKWTVFNKFDSKLPDNRVFHLSTNDSGGLWVGTRGGLAYLSSGREWTIFNSENSGLPDNRIFTFLDGGNNDLWISSYGISHLTFGQKGVICNQLSIDNSQCQDLYANRRAAIIIAGGGNDESNSLWDTTESISNYLYHVLIQRGFVNEEIYYLSPASWADFNNDKQNDGIIDAPNPARPLVVDDISAALQWATNRGKLDQPLYLFFIDHGDTDRLQVAKNTKMNILDFKTMLDTYQATTKNEMVLMLEACYSGILLEQLTAPNRAIISSTGNGLAYFDRIYKQGFSRFFADGLLKGQSLYEAFESASHQQQKLLGDTELLTGSSTKTLENITQIPQFNDGKNGQWLRELYLNGSFVTADLTLAVEGLTTSTTMPASKPIQIKAKAGVASGKVKQVWAIIRPPKINFIMDSYGTPILAFPRVTLSPTEEQDVWETTWQDTVYNGDYEITFYAEDNDSNIASSDNSVIISITDGVEPPEQANMQIVMAKDRYRPGEQIKVELIENLGWVYDLYAAVVMPDGNFMAFKNTNDFASINNAKTWRGLRVQNSPATIVDLTLPEDLATGEYCLYGILSPEQNDVFETLAQGLSVVEQQCFNIFEQDLTDYKD
jgi:ligand-binding sensor domain-containing protein